MNERERADDPEFFMRCLLMLETFHFAIRHGSFATVDDAIALNAHDYATATPSLGWIEHGEIHDVVDLPLTRGKAVGFFASGEAWRNWKRHRKRQAQAVATAPFRFSSWAPPPRRVRTMVPWCRQV